MRADGLAQNVADFRRYQILAGGMRTARLKSGAGTPQAKQRPRRAEIFALPAQPASSLDFPANRAQPCKRPVNLEIERNSARVQIVYANVPGKRSRPAERTCLWVLG